MKRGKAPKILLLDSNALIHRSFHALPPLTTPNGELVNAVYGFAAALLKAIQDEKPDYVVACFDIGRKTFRNEIYDQYKANRKETDSSLSDQIPRVREIVEVLNIPIFTQKGLEADDLIGSLTKIAAKEGVESVIVTGDNDALQLVNDSTSVYSLRRGVTDTLTYKRSMVKEKLGIFPEQVVDYKALAGDASDNIPGAPGVGPKTATDLLVKYGDLDSIYQHLDELKERTGQILGDNKEQVYMSKRLAAIRTDLKIDLNLKEADVSNFDFSKVIGLFRELGFKSLLSKLPAQARTEQSSLFEAGQESEPKVTATLPWEAVTKMERWEEIAVALSSANHLAIDTETDGINGQPIGISFAWGEDSAAYLPLAPAYPTGLSLEDLRPSLQKILGGESKKIGHNIKYDLHSLSRVGIETSNIWFDTMIASQLVNPQLYAHSLDDLALSELGIKKISITSLIGPKSDGSMIDAPLEQLAAYACEDALVTWRLCQKMRPSLEEAALKRVFYQIEMPLLPVLFEMERHGVMLDRAYLAKLKEDFQLHLSKIDKQAKALLGEDINIASPSQLQEALFNKLGLPVVGIKKIKSGYSTDADSLGKLKGKHPSIALILEHREVAKLLNTYIETLPALLDDNDRVHTSFGQIGAATGRMSSNNPNLQNIPIRTELGNKVRRTFIAEKGCVFLGADYSQAELRVLAHLSDDPALIQAFSDKNDFHSEVSQKLGVDRRTAKAINFGIIYGLGSLALANDLGVSVAEAKAFIDRYFATFPGVTSFIDRMKDEARNIGYVETAFGRRRYLPDIHSPNPGLRAAAERMAVNMPAQGTVADLMKMSMVALQGKLPPKANLLLQIHDELLLEVPEKIVAEVAEIVRETMASAANFKVAMTVGTKVGHNWADLKTLESQ